LNAKQQGEKEFFKLVVLSVLLSSPSFMIEQLVDKDPQEMYKRAKKEGIMFQNFHEWIAHDINKTMYTIDLQFFELEA
jgi:hypothetical protein